MAAYTDEFSELFLQATENDLLDEDFFSEWTDLPDGFGCK